MKVAVCLAVLITLVFADQITAQDSLKIEVIKFSWSRYEQRKLIEDQTEFDKQNSNPLNVKEKKESEKSIDEKSRDLSRIENTARNSALTPSGNIFLYELQVKNLDQKNIKSFIWEYRPASKSLSQNDSSRRFLCSEKIKAGDSKTLRTISYLPPINMVDATAASEESKKNSAADVIINRVEYTDGTVWKRADWDDSKYRLDSSKTVEKLKFSSCAAL